VWVNNAGCDGHSTYGHLRLVDQYVSAIRPRVVLLLVGLNDVGREDLNAFEQGSLRTEGYAGESLAHIVHRQVLRHCDVYALVDNLRRHGMAKSRGLTHQAGMGHAGFQSIRHAGLSDEERARILRADEGRCVERYRQRLAELVTQCRDLGIRVVLITQPALYGDGIDDARGINLETVSVGNADGWTQWRRLQRYNQATTEIGRDLEVPVIAAAEKMPKSSRYYYDFTHYTIHERGRRIPGHVA
jgi:hypothetical protein